jgi:hypothetical protein
MTEEELSRAMREYEKVRSCDTMKPSLEARMERLEADASAQRAAILRLERAFDAVSYAMGTFGFCFLVLVLALAVRT